MCGPGGGAGDAGASFDAPSITESYDPESFSGIGVESGKSMDPEGYEGQSGFTASGAPGMGQGIGPSPDSGDPMALGEALNIGLTKATQKNPTMMGLSTIVPGLGFLGLAAAMDNAPPGSLAAAEGDDPGPGPEGSGGDWEAEEAARVSREKAAADKAAADKAAADKKAAAEKKTADTAAKTEEKAAAGVKDDFDAKAASAAKESRRRALAAATTAQPTIRTSPRGILGAPSAIVRKRLLGA